MSKNILFFLLITGFVSCKSSHNEAIHFFNEYDYNNRILNKDVLVFKINLVDSNESKIILEGNSPDFNFKDEFFEKINKNKSIDRKFNKEYVSYYPVDSVGRELSRVEIKKIPLLFFPDVIFSGKKKFEVSKREYTFYRFSEYYNDIGLRSYYLEDFGFIAFDLTNGRYFLCTKTSGQSNISKRKLTSLCQKLVHDTTFFSMYQFKK
jgi:hypothetical protein